MGKLIAFGWYGGKFSHLGWLLPLLPKTRHFCEPFAGSAAVLLNREPSPVETYNDIDVDKDNLFAAPYALVHNCDPPYPHDSRGDSKAYVYEMTDEEHRQLADVLRYVKGKVALSSYHCDLMDELYSDWHFIEAPMKNCHSIKKPRTEILWVNYQLEEAIECQHQQKSLTPLFNELPLISSSQ